jgi:hypothetical protein
MYTRNMPARTSGNKKSIPAPHTASKQKQLKAVQDANLQLRKELHEDICGGDKSLKLVPAHCVGIKGPRDPSKKAPTRKHGDSAAIQKEIKILKEHLKTYPKGYTDKDVSGDLLATSVTLFRLMIDTDYRTRYPDPVKRYNASLERLLTTVVKSSNVKPSDWPRNTIMKLVLHYMNTLLHDHAP